MPVKPKIPAKTKGKTVATLRHDAKRKNLPTVEYQSLMREAEKSPIQVAYSYLASHSGGGERRTMTGHAAESA